MLPSERCLKSTHPDCLKMMFSLNDERDDAFILSNSIDRICLIEMKNCGMQPMMGVRGCGK